MLSVAIALGVFGLGVVSVVVMSALAADGGTSAAAESPTPLPSWAWDEEKQSERTTPAPQVRTPRLSTQEQALLDDDWERAGDGVYLKWAPADELTCGYWDCAGLWAIAVDGCSNSLYIEVAIVAGETHVGMDNDRTTTLEPMGTASFLFEDYTDNGDGFKLTKVNCY